MLSHSVLHGQTSTAYPAFQAAHAPFIATQVMHQCRTDHRTSGWIIGLQALLAAHARWFKLQACEDRFAGVLGIDDLCEGPKIATHEAAALHQSPTDSNRKAAVSAGNHASGAPYIQPLSNSLRTLSVGAPPALTKGQLQQGHNTCSAKSIAGCTSALPCNVIYPLVSWAGPDIAACTACAYGSRPVSGVNPAKYRVESEDSNVGDDRASPMAGNTRTKRSLCSVCND